MKARPLKIVPCANSVKQEAELINLELGMRDVKRAESNGIKPLLTAVQLHELHLQTVIYNHIAAGVAVPCHLVLHVWKSLAISCGDAVLNKLFPSFVGFSSQGFESRNIIDSEPGRCRRTDGKKWRCSRSVLPNQKYCERHMHRGCQRSRKLVEAIKDAPPADSTPPSKPNTNSETSNAGLSASKPVSRQLMATPSTSGHKNNNSSTNDIPSSDESKRCANVNQNTHITVSATSEIVAESRRPITTSINNVCILKNDEDSDWKHGFHNRLGDKSVVTSSNIRRNVKIDGNASFGFGFSSKIVHQGRDGSRLDQQSITESKPGRCRRTDGKKWRCSREVLPFQKYCGKHIHRGAKKLRALTQLDTPSDHAAPPSSRSSPTMTVPKKEDSSPSSIGSPLTVAIPRRLDSSRLSTNLSISTPANAQVMTYDGHTQDTSSGSSDTTISDNIPAYRATQLVSSRT